MKPTTEFRSKAPIGSPEAIAEYKRWRAASDRETIRKVRNWARTWERCPLAGCRRNDRCLHFDDCRGVPEGEVTPEHMRLIRAWLDGGKRSTDAETGPLYDPKDV